MAKNKKTVITKKKPTATAKPIAEATAAALANAPAANGNGGVTGSYIFDRAMGKVVKVSSDIPRVASQGPSEPACETSGPCGPQACGGGACMPGGLD